jgi:hypothetical protein
LDSFGAHGGGAGWSANKVSGGGEVHT